MDGLCYVLVSDNSLVIQLQLIRCTFIMMVYHLYVIEFFNNLRNVTYALIQVTSMTIFESELVEIIMI